MTQQTPTELDSKDQIDSLLDISTLLNTGLDRKSLSICVDLLESGVNPHALAIVVKELNKN